MSEPVRQSVVFYDPATGRILFCHTSRPDHIAADGRPYVVVDRHAKDWDCTHKVVDGALVPLTPAEAEGERPQG